VTDAAGTPHNDKLSFDRFGGRRDADWSAGISSGDLVTMRQSEDERFSRGFTDHEVLNRIGFVHMNGRVYDPRIGRFVSADPIVQAPFHSQSYNRYSYTSSGPLSYTDPSGVANAESQLLAGCTPDSNSRTLGIEELTETGSYSATSWDLVGRDNLWTLGSDFTLNDRLPEPMIEGSGGAPDPGAAPKDSPRNPPDDVDDDYTYTENRNAAQGALFMLTTWAHAIEAAMGSPDSTP
jgi:RHS repeat-associated protein